MHSKVCPIGSDGGTRHSWVTGLLCPSIGLNVSLNMPSLVCLASTSTLASTHPAYQVEGPSWVTKLRDQVEGPSWGTKMRDHIDGPRWGTKLRDQVEGPSWGTKLRCIHSEGKGPTELVRSSSLVSSSWVSPVSSIAGLSKVVLVVLCGKSLRSYKFAHTGKFKKSLYIFTFFTYLYSICKDQQAPTGHSSSPGPLCLYCPISQTFSQAHSREPTRAIY